MFSKQQHQQQQSPTPRDLSTRSTAMPIRTRQEVVSFDEVLSLIRAMIDFFMSDVHGSNLISRGIFVLKTRALQVGSAPQQRMGSPLMSANASRSVKKPFVRRNTFGVLARHSPFSLLTITCCHCCCYCLVLQQTRRQKVQHKELQFRLPQINHLYDLIE